MCLESVTTLHTPPLDHIDCWKLFRQNTATIEPTFHGVYYSKDERYVQGQRYCIPEHLSSLHVEDNYREGPSDSPLYYPCGYHAFADKAEALEYCEFDDIVALPVRLYHVHTTGTQALGVFNGSTKFITAYVGEQFEILSADIDAVTCKKEELMSDDLKVTDPETMAQQIMDGSILQSSLPDPRFPADNIRTRLVKMGLSESQADAVTQDMFRIVGGDSTNTVIVDAREMLESVKEELEELRGQVEDLGTGDLESDANSLASDASDLSSKADDLVSQVQDLENSCSDVRKSAERLDRSLSAKVDEAESTLAEVKSNQEAILRILQRAAVTEDPDVVKQRNAEIRQLCFLVERLPITHVESLSINLSTATAAAARVRSLLPKEE